MPFVKYEAPAKPAKTVPDVKIGALGISINRGAAEKFGLADATSVNLWFDSDSSRIAITKTDGSDRSAFKAKPRGKSGDTLFIAATKFYSAFNISIPEKGTTANLQEVEGMPAFALPGGKSEPSKPYTGAKRGRKPKSGE